MPTFDFHDGQTITSGMPPTYVTLEEANNYFQWVLYSASWESASNDDKCKAIVQATRSIDRLNFAGLRTSDWDRFRNSGQQAGFIMGPLTLDASSTLPPPGQPLEFPRNGHHVIPEDIKSAACEIALNLLDGIDAEMEMKGLGTHTQRFSTASTAFDTAAARMATRHGIVSYTAWNFLFPYLADPLEFSLKRVN